MRSASTVIKICGCSEEETAAIQPLSYLRIVMPFSKHFAFITKIWSVSGDQILLGTFLSVLLRTLHAKRKRLFANLSGGVRFANKANKSMAPGVREQAVSLHSLAHRWILSKGMISIGYPESKATKIVFLRG